MAKIKDIQKRENKTPKKSIQGRVQGFAAFLTLPTILGLVKARSIFIEKGVKVNALQALRDSVYDLFKEAQENPITRIMSGAKPLETAIQQHKRLLKGVMPDTDATFNFKKVIAEFSDPKREVEKLIHLRARGVEPGTHPYKTRFEGLFKNVAEHMDEWSDIEVGGVTTSAVTESNIGRNENIANLNIHGSSKDASKHLFNIKLLRQRTKVLSFINKHMHSWKANPDGKLSGYVPRLDLDSTDYEGALKAVQEADNEFLKKAQWLEKQWSLGTDEATPFSEQRWKEITEPIKRTPPVIFKAKLTPKMLDDLYVTPDPQAPKLGVTSILGKSDGELIDTFKGAIENYDQGLSAVDQRRLPSLSRFNKQMGKANQFYQGIFKSTGQLGLYNSAYGAESQARGLAKMVENFRGEIQDIKGQHLRWNDGSDAGKEAIRLLAGKAGLEPGDYLDMIEKMDVDVQITSDLHGNLAHQQAVITINVGNKGKITHKIGLDRFGQFSTGADARLYNSFINMPFTNKGVVGSLEGTGMAQINAMTRNAAKIFNDLKDARYDVGPVEQQIQSFMRPYTEIAGTATGHAQDIVRGTKIQSDEFRSLSGQKSSYYYKSMVAGKKSLFTDVDVNQTGTTLVALDAEFNTISSDLKGSFKMVDDAHARIYWMNYVVKKGGSKDKIINHFIMPENWSSIQESVELFMARHQSGGGADLDGFSQWYKWLGKAFEQAEDKGVLDKDFVTLDNMLNPRTGKTENIKIYSDKGAVISMAKNIYESAEAVGHPVWLGHNIETADLPMLHKMAQRALEAKDLSGHDKRLVKRLHRETSASFLRASNTTIDTYAYARFLHLDTEYNTSLKLTSIFDQLMSDSVGNPKIAENWSANLASAVEKSMVPGSITGEVKRLVNDLPTDVRAGVIRWIQDDPKDLIAVFGSAGHHDPGFDTRKSLILKDLLHWKRNQIRQYNPSLYKRIMDIGHISEEIVSGNNLSWQNPIEQASKMDLFNLDSSGQRPEGISQDAVRSHMFAFSPTVAARGLGAAFGPENYLPFGHKTNLQKQMYQTATQNTLFPGVGREIAASKRLFPVIEQSLDGLGTDSGMSIWTTALRANMSRLNITTQSLAGQFADRPVKSMLQLYTYYLPHYNSIVGEDTGLLSPSIKKKILGHFPLDPAGKTVKVFSNEAAQLLVANSKGSTTSITDWLRQSGVSDEIIGMVEADKNYANRSLANLVEDMATSNNGKLSLPLSRSKSSQNVLEPGETFVRAKNVAQAVEDVDTKKGYYLANGTKYRIDDPLKTQAFLESITFDTHGNFLFNITPFEKAPGIVKTVDQLKLFKGYIVGQGSGITWGTGVGLVLGAKKPNIAQMIDIQMRRSLTQIYNDYGTDLHTQKQKVIELLKKSFDLTDEQFENCFKLKRASVAAHQTGYSTHIWVPEVVSTSQINSSNSALIRSTFRMLEISGISHNKLRKQFVDMFKGEILGLVGSKTNADKIKADLGKIYDLARTQQEKYLRNIAQNTDAPAAAATANAMLEEMKKTKAAYYDPFLTIEKSSIDIESVRKDGLFVSNDKLARGVQLVNFGHALASEISISESLFDVKTPQPILKDAYGTPIHKTFSIWQVLMASNASRHSPVLRKGFMAQVLPTMGKFDDNIKAALATYFEAASFLRDGTKDTSHLSDIYKMKTEEITEQIQWIKAQEAVAADSLAIQEAYGIDTGQMKIAKNELARYNLVELETGLLSEENKNKIKVFSVKEKYISFELPNMDKIFKTDQMSAGEKQKIHDIVIKQKSILQDKMKEALRNKSQNPGERRLLEQAFRESWSKGDGGPLGEILVPNVIADGPRKVGNGWIVSGPSRRILNIQQAFYTFNDQLEQLADSTDKSFDVKLSGIKSASEQLLTTSGRNLVSMIYGATNFWGWKSSQFYGAGSQYAKTVNSLVMAKQALGTVMAKEAGDRVKVNLANTDGTKAIVQALENIKKASSETHKKLFDGLIEEVKGITIKDVLEGISAEGPKKEAKVLGKMLQEIDGQQFFSAKGTGFGERIGTWGQAAASLNTITSSEDDLLAFVKALVDPEGNHNKTATEAILGARKTFKGFLTGDKRTIEYLSRSPWFENLAGMQHSLTFLWHDELFQEMGLTTKDLNRITMVGQMELAIQNGDFDGDLTQKMMDIRNSFGGWSKDEKINLIKQYDPGRDLETLQNMDSDSLGAIFKQAEQVSAAEEISRLRQALNIKLMRGDKSQAIGGDYSRMLEVNGRWLIPEAVVSEQSAQENVQALLKSIGKDFDEEAVKQRNLTYMIQQNLTGPIGQQQKRFDTQFQGGERSAMKAGVVNAIADIHNHPNRNKALNFLAENLDEFDIDEATKDNTYLEGKVRELASRAQNAWDTLNKQSKLKQYGSTGIGTTGWSEMRMTHLDYMNMYLAHVTHEIPIEKEKSSSKSLIAFVRSHQTLSRLHRGGDAAEAKEVSDILFGSLPIEQARGENLLYKDGVKDDDFVRGVREQKERSRLVMQESTERVMYLKKLQRSLVSQNLIYGDTVSPLLGNQAKQGIYGALLEAATPDNSMWISDALTRVAGHMNPAGSYITNAGDAALLLTQGIFDGTLDRTPARAGIEVIGRAVSESLHGVFKHRWSKRAGIAALALTLFDPNTNSMLLPDSRADGERYDIPSMNELSRSRRNRKVKVRETSPILLDKLGQLVGVDVAQQFPGYKNDQFLPPPPPGSMSYTKVKHRNDPLSLRQIAKQVNGILLN